MKGLWPLLATLCIAGCTDDAPWDGTPIQIWGREQALYMKGDASEEVECSGGNAPRECGSLSTSGLTDQIFFDCSDVQFECLFNGGVMAVPRADLAAGQNYTIFGANLTVERCFSDQTSCDFALIRSECALGVSCRCRFGQTTVFYYSRDRGITAYYHIGPPPVPVDPKYIADATALFTFVLIAEHGFLRVPLALRKATSEDYCG
jgi:hypothetical protein